jgi:acetyltransferase, GNAT family
MELQTKRLILGPWQESDAETLYKYARNPNVGSAAGWSPHSVGRLVILPFVTLYGRKTSVTNMQEMFGRLQTSFINYNR